MTKLSLFIIFPEDILNFAADDIYYYLELSENLLNGRGLTYNGSPTNGFHPLYPFIIAPIYAILSQFGKEAPVLGIQFLSLMSITLTGLFIYLIGYDLWGDSEGLIGAAIWLFNPVTTQLALSGMEVSFQPLFVSLLVYYYLTLDPNQFSNKQAAVLGTLIASAFLIRMDSIFLSVGIALAICLHRLNSNYSNLLKIVTSRDLLTVFGTALLLVSPWLIWSKVVVGSVFPISGSAQRILRLGLCSSSAYSPYICSVSVAATAFFKNIIPFLVAFPIKILPLTNEVIIPSLIVALFIFLVYIGYSTSTNLIKYTHKSKFNFLIFGAILFISYHIFRHLHFRDYYGLFLFFIISIFAGRVISVFKNNSRIHISTNLVIYIVVAILLMNSVVAVIGYGISFSRQPEVNDHLREGANYIETELPDNARVGAFNAGTYQYYSDKDVINLDGVINPEAFRALKTRSLGCYLYNQNITYIVDLSGTVKPRVEQFSQHSPTLSVHDRVTNRITVYRLSWNENMRKCED